MIIIISVKNTTWMYINDYWWTLSPNSDNSYTVFCVESGSIHDYYGADDTNTAVRPVLYLSSEITLTGSGTQSDPYVVSS